MDVFVRDSARLDYNNLVARNAFLLDLSIYVAKSRQLVQSVCLYSNFHPCQAQADTSSSSSASVSARLLTFLKYIFGPCPSLADFRQPLKIAFTILIATISVVDEDLINVMGPATIWSIIAISFTASSHPGSK